MVTEGIHRQIQKYLLSEGIMNEFEWNETLMFNSVISVNLAKEHSLWHDLYLLTEGDSNPYRNIMLNSLVMSSLIGRKYVQFWTRYIYRLVLIILGTSTDNMETQSKSSSYWSCCPETGKERYSFCFLETQFKVPLDVSIT